MDEIYGSTEYEVSSLPLGTTVKQTFKFNEVFLYLLFVYMICLCYASLVRKQSNITCNIFTKVKCLNLFTLHVVASENTDVNRVEI